jgi:hypothetical protein
LTLSGFGVVHFPTEARVCYIYPDGVSHVFHTKILERRSSLKSKADGKKYSAQAECSK